MKRPIASRLWGLGLCVLAVGLGAVPARAAEASPSPFPALAERYIAERMAADPVNATEAGVHAYDDRLPDLSAAAIARDIAALRGWERRLRAITASGDEAIDLELLRHDVAARLVESAERQSWRHLPDFYADKAIEGIFALVKRSFASPEARLRAVIARTQQIPVLLAEARKNLRAVPKVSLDIALEKLPGAVDFLRNDTPAAFAAVSDAELRRRLTQAIAAATGALDDYADFLRRSIGPRAVASFAIGEAVFRHKLRADEGIDEPLDVVLRRGEAELARLQRAFKQAAAAIDPHRPAAEVQAEISADHGRPETLLADVRARLDGLRRFVREHHLASVPSEVMPIVTATPGFLRAFSLASMDAPGPFETQATEAYYQVTLPDPKWPAAEIEDFMRGAFNRFVIDTGSIHEVFPGHYLQFLWLQRLHSPVRKFYSCAVNNEGWAHYVEQMLIDEGWGDHDPKLRLAQLQDALLRAARYVAGIRMHTRGMTLAQAIELFQTQGFQTRKVAEMEAKRGTEDPTYLYYTYGKLEILRLRDDYRQLHGADYSLERFHDAFLRQGALPLALMRRVLLAGTGQQ